LRACVVLEVTAPADVNVELRNDCERLEGEPHAWKWPDVAFGAEAWALLQFTIPVARLVAGSTPDLPIAICVREGEAGSTPLFIVATLPPLPVVTADAWAALPADMLVAAADPGDRGRRDAQRRATGHRTRRLDDGRSGADRCGEALRRQPVDAGNRRNHAPAGCPARCPPVTQRSGVCPERTESSAGILQRGASLRLEEAGIPMFLRRKGEQGKGKPTIQPDRLPQTAAPKVARRAMPVPMHARARPPVGPGSRAEPPVR
jgi:hypothetical protein